MHQCNVTSKFDKSLVGYFQLLVYIYRMVYYVVIKFYVFALFGQDQVLWQDTVAGNGACVFSNFEGLYLSMCCLFVFHVCQVL